MFDKNGLSHDSMYTTGTCDPGNSNSHIEVKVRHLIAALCAADDVIAAANNR